MQKKPNILILENVKYIKYIKGGNVFKYIISSLESLGYNVSYKLLNAKDFGVPQNRERWIFVGTLGYTFNFKTPKYKSKIIKDFLDKNGNFVYLDEEHTSNLIEFIQ